MVRWLEHAGQFGRNTFGGDGAEADAVILSQLTGKPVRVQWTLQEDLAWSSASPGWVSDIKGGLDANGRLIAVHSAFLFAAHDAMRVLWAPCSPACLQAPPSRADSGDGMALRQDCKQAGASLWHAERGSRVAVRRAARPDHAHARAAATELRAGVADQRSGRSRAAPIRSSSGIQHTSDQRLIDILNATAKAAGWESRPSPHPSARKTGTDPVTGRGVCIIVRANALLGGHRRGRGHSGNRSQCR